ncbi:MAG: hypothetical protein WCF85_18920 [Rhodospirillaceae bacterium]
MTGKSIMVAAAVGFMILPCTVGVASAQVAAAQPQTTTAAPAKVQEVSPRDLMTLRERFDMWRQMRAANTPEEKFALWQRKHDELQARAAKQGAVLRDPMMREHGPMMMEHSSSSGSGSTGNRNWSWGMTGHGNALHPQPPMGR